jgi:hypothetical protein
MLLDSILCSKPAFEILKHDLFDQIEDSLLSGWAGNATRVHGTFPVQAGIKTPLITKTFQETRYDDIEFEQILALLDEESLKDVPVSFG